jgi:hypothetical protein
VGGPIYPIIFATGAMGSARGATDWVSMLGGQYVYICTAAAMSTGLAALLHTQDGPVEESCGTIKWGCNWV